MHDIHDINDEVVEQLLIHCGGKNIKKLYIGMSIPQLQIRNENGDDISMIHEDEEESKRLKGHCPNKHPLIKFEVDI